MAEVNGETTRYMESLLWVGGKMEYLSGRLSQWSEALVMCSWTSASDTAPWERPGLACLPLRYQKLSNTALLGFVWDKAVLLGGKLYWYQTNNRLSVRYQGLSIEAFRLWTISAGYSTVLTSRAKDATALNHCSLSWRAWMKDYEL